jgi:ABC-type phosphate/phosphonate transport system substrate-binding protein
MVAAGEVDASAIDSQVLAIELRDHPELAREPWVIEEFGPSLIQPYVVSQRLSEEVKSALRASLVAIADDPEAHNALAHGFVERFVPITDADYGDMRRMLAAAEEADFLELA